MRIQKDLGKLEEVLEAPGELSVIATVRFLRKNRHVLVEIESDEGVSRRVLRKSLRRLSLEL